jgi:hypothetical protein
MALNTNSLKIFNLVLNLLMFFGTAAAALITLFEMKVHFNLGNKISYLMVTFSLVMRISLTCQEFHSGVYTRETWKYYYKWFMNFGFMVFYFNCFFKVTASWKVSYELKQRSDAIRSLDI